MKIRCLLSLITVLGVTNLVQAEINIDNNLQDQMQAVGPDGTVSALIFMVEQADIKSLSDSISREKFNRDVRHELVVETLQLVASESQSSILQRIETLRSNDLVDRVDSFWISNVIRIDARPEIINQLAKRRDVAHIYLNYDIELVKPVSTGSVSGATSRGANEAGVQAVRAPEVWNMGYTGEGVLVATLDTGVQGSHEALASRWAGLRPEYAGHPEWAFLDPFTNNNAFPFDSASHGTHTMGTVCGGAPGPGIGVAPGAHWITSAGIDRGSIAQTVADAIQSFQWFTDPDGNPATSWDVPRVCSNSWGVTASHGYPNCDQTFWAFLDNLEAAGCVVLFSAGNEGFGGLRRPSDRATDDYRTLAVAAIDPFNPSYPIASFSSRGPTACTPLGGLAIKPDISAPGVNTVSSVPGGYSTFNGTSMASPHVNGAVALIVQANPGLEVQAIKEILYATAVDLGPFGEDNDYGHGIIDCVAAVNMALETVTVAWSYPGGRPEFLEPTGGTEIPITISGTQIAIDPSTAMLHLVPSISPPIDIPLVYDGGANFRAVFPTLDCGDTIAYYFSIETTGGASSFSPFSAPSVKWSGDAWSGHNALFDDDFQSDQGWTVVAGAGTGNWIRVVPSGGGARCDAATDSDGSGACYVTGNGTDEDVDNGSTVLTSPTLDGSAAGAILSYDFWYSNGSNCGGADPQNDVFIVEISDSNGLNWQSLETVGPAGSEVSGGWITRDWLIENIPNVTPNNSMRIRFTVGDLNAGSIVEAGVDSVHIGNFFCDEIICIEDINGDGTVDITDLLAVIADWGASNSSADINGDNVVNVSDLLMVIAAWGSC